MKQFDTIVIELENQVKLFGLWSESVDTGYYNWEDDYPNWNDVSGLFIKILNEVPLSNWTNDLLNNMLYVLSRDHESEVLAMELVKSPQHLILLGQYGKSYTDYKARWQLCYYLSEVYQLEPMAEDIILHYVQNDPEEYVRRRALLSLGYIKSKYAEENALKAWSTNLEYQKIGALEVLHQINSIYLEQYLKKALNDESDYVRQNAERIILEQ